MEISNFFLTEKTLILRANFLSGLETRIKTVLDNLEPLTKGSGNFNNVEEAFQETHRIKGAGGTYGFLEATLTAREAIKYLRPSFNESSIVEADDAVKARDIFVFFLQKIFPELVNITKAIINYQEEKISLPLLFCYDNNRLALEYLQQKMMDDQIPLYTCNENEQLQDISQIVDPLIFLKFSKKNQEIYLDKKKSTIFLPGNIQNENLYKIILDKINNFHVE